jgi:hypothetical protein
MVFYNEPPFLRTCVQVFMDWLSVACLYNRRKGLKNQALKRVSMGNWDGVFLS